MNRFDLIPPFAEQEVLKALNIGAEKHGLFNYRTGKTWTEHISSIQKNLHQFKDCNDLNEEGLYYIAKVAASAIALLDMYKTNPKADDRWTNKFQNKLKIGLDIDEVVADFLGHYMRWFKIDSLPPYWNCDFNIVENLDKIKDNKEFWLTIPKLRDVDFEPTAYITSRAWCDQKITEEWIMKVGLPAAPVITVCKKSDKIQVIKDLDLDVFVDDSYETFCAISKAGVAAAYLMNHPHNQHYNVGVRRIYDLKQF